MTTVAYPYAARTSLKPVGVSTVRFTESNEPHRYSLGEKDAFEIEIRHPLITQAELNAMQTFYDNNAHAMISIVAADGSTYEGLFKHGYRWVQRGALYNAWTFLLGNKS